MDSDAVYLTARLLSRHTCRNAFFLASHEFRDLSRPWPWALMAALGERLHVMGCAEDTWLSREQYDTMLEAVPGLQATWHPDLRHAFCISQPQSQAVADSIAAIAQPHLPPHPHPHATPGGSGGCDGTASPASVSDSIESDSSRSGSASSAGPSPARCSGGGSQDLHFGSGLEGSSEQQPRGSCGEGATDVSSGEGAAAGAPGGDQRRQPWAGSRALGYAAATFSLVSGSSSSGWGSWGGGGVVARGVARRQAAGHGESAR
ncbi:hypothetical protein TSOC_013146 [Tetrabaena socialis]|uniref:Uncharacterized protein n=1 Tax=Tetrabaena socialis TaxID=47790 RepID=A0A2J7ZL38_9CHLO|nr:hypothetical protein TSOC_013146 [Tetrabaena socialis]|eukprot:PNH00989.1 hypothetical protein TSOC_013146 [Tetrabaena socialis]